MSAPWNTPTGAAYRVDALYDVPADRLAVTCVRCGAIYAVLQEIPPERSLLERAFGPLPEAQRIMREEGHGVGGRCRADPIFPFREMDDDLAKQWEHIQARVRAVLDGQIPDPDASRRAMRWVLVHAFGDVRKYQFDAEFHARVHVAEQMLEHLQDPPPPRLRDDDARTVVALVPDRCSPEHPCASRNELHVALWGECFVDEPAP